LGVAEEELRDAQDRRNTTSAKNRIKSPCRQNLQ
jgi:hypothetical protein